MKRSCCETSPMLILMIAIAGGMWGVSKLVDWRFGKLSKDKRERLKNLGRVGLMFCGWLLWFCVISLLMRYFVPFVAISPETTHVTGPLNDEGFIDVIAAIEERFGAKCKPEDNGFRFLLTRFGIDELYRDSSPEQRKFYGDALNQKLAIPDNNVPDAVYQSPYQYFEERFKAEDIVEDDDSLNDKLREKVDSLLEKPWDEDAISELAEWFAANNAALDLFGEAVRFPCFYAPVVREDNRTLLYDLLYYDVRFIRELVAGLQCRIMHSLTIGDTEQAIDDAMTITRLADARMRHATSAMHFLIAVGFRDRAELAFIDILRYGEFSSEQLAKLRDDRRQYDFLLPISDLVFLTRMETMQSLHELMMFRFDRKGSVAPPPSTFGRFMYFVNTPFFKTTVWTPVLKDFQKKFDAWDEIAAQSPGRTQIEAFSAQSQRKEFGLDMDWKKLVQQCFWKGKFVTVFQMISEINISWQYSSLISHVHCYHRAETRARLLDIAFALELYRHDCGQYPVTLDELTGKYLTSIPNDPFTDGDAFHYRLESSTDYLLYSVGSNGQDDDGVSDYDWRSKPTGEQPENAESQKTGDDIRIRMPRDG